MVDFSILQEIKKEGRILVSFDANTKNEAVGNWKEVLFSDLYLRYDYNRKLFRVVKNRNIINSLSDCHHGQLLKQEFPSMELIKIKSTDETDEYKYFISVDDTDLMYMRLFWA